MGAKERVLKVFPDAYAYSWRSQLYGHEFVVIRGPGSQWSVLATGRTAAKAWGAAAERVEAPSHPVTPKNRPAEKDSLTA